MNQSIAGPKAIDAAVANPFNDYVRKRKKTANLTLLGRSEMRLPSSPAEAQLEVFANPSRRKYRIRFETADFTSLCPVTGQVDFAQITIEYVPNKVCIESKSLKFYLASFRNLRAFNEAVTNRILDDFVRNLRTARSSRDRRVLRSRRNCVNRSRRISGQSQ